MQSVEVVQQRRETAFVSFVVTVQTMVVLEGDTLFVEGVVGEVHGLVVQIGPFRHFVVLSAEPHQSFLVEQHLQRVSTPHHHKYSQVKLKSIY